MVFQRGDDVRPRLLRQALALLQGVYRTEVYAIIHIRPAATLYEESFMDHCSAVLCVAALRVHQTLWIGGVVAMIRTEQNDASSHGHVSSATLTGAQPRRLHRARFRCWRIGEYSVTTVWASVSAQVTRIGDRASTGRIVSAGPRSRGRTERTGARAKTWLMSSVGDAFKCGLEERAGQRWRPR